MAHSLIVGGSTAKRVINCPGSVALVATMPPQEGSSYANEGSLLHEAIAIVMDTACAPEDMVGFEAHGLTLTEELLERKLKPALALLNEYDPKAAMEFLTEAQVNFGDLMPGVFGSSDIIGRLEGRAVILDWKFGDGVMVEAEENMQLMFYAAAAMRTRHCAWAFEGVTEVECVIIQPPYLRTWTTTVERIAEATRILAQHPLIGHPVRGALRELVISSGKTGYVALHRLQRGLDEVQILAVRHQREAGFGE